MGVRQKLYAVNNSTTQSDSEFAVWQEEDGSIAAYQNGNALVAAEVNPNTGGIRGIVAPDGKLLPALNPSGFRPRFLTYGNSLAGQSNTSLVASTTTLSSAAAAGGNTVTVASIGTIANGNKLAIALYDGTIFTTTVNGAPAGNVVTLASPLPRMARQNANVLQYTTTRPGGIRKTGGPVYMGLAMIGMPVQMVQGYGYGGGTLPEVMTDLPRVLEAIKPQYVHFIDVENSMGLTSVQLISWTKYKIEMCLNYSAVPLVNVAYPSSSYTAGAVVSTYDAYNAYVRGQMKIDYPMAVCIDVGEQWIDQAQPTLRTPLSGWTDGVHPNPEKYVAIGAMFSSEFSQSLPASTSLVNQVLSANPTLSGSGGTNSGMQGGSVVPTNWTFTADAGVTATSTNATEGKRIAATVPGTSNVSSTTLKASVRYTTPANTGPDQALFGYVKVKINDLTGVNMLYPYLDFSSGMSYAGGQDSVTTGYADLIGKTITLETPIVRTPEGVTYCDLYLWARPTTGLSNGVSIDIEIIEAGLCPAALITH